MASTTDEQITTDIERYKSVQTTAQDANAFLQQLARTSKQVEDHIAAAPTQIDTGKKAVTSATDALARLADASPDLYAPHPEKALGAASNRLAEAEKVLQAKPPSPLHAYDSAFAAITIAEGVSSSVDALTQAYDALKVQSGKLASARSKGFKLAEADARFTGALNILSEGARYLESEAGDQDAKLDATMGRGREAIKGAGLFVEQEVDLQAANVKALSELHTAGEELKSYIDKGAEAFDAVDEYAESTWQDIRGNGTEAQHEADHAFDLWQSASRLNELSSDSVQDFTAAKGQIAQAQSSISTAKELIVAILDRLRHLKESQRTAQAEIQAAQTDISGGRSFVTAYDLDISVQPADMLAQAESLLAGAKEEVAKPKPDWIEVVSLARQANDLADKALSDARTQEEAMQARRQKLGTVSQQAEASLSRVSNFASVHRSDVDSAVLEAIASAQASMQHGQQLSEQAGLAKQVGGAGLRLQDVALGKALEDAAAAMVEVQQAADRAYKKAKSQFSAMEKLRRETYQVVQSAQAVISKVESYIQRNRGDLSRISRNRITATVQSAIDTMPQWQHGAKALVDAEALHALAAAAKQAEELANQAYADARQEVEKVERERRREEERDRNSSSMFGGFSSSSSSSRSISFGGSSSSSGHWGGGGASSSSFGRGGSSSGSFGGGGSSSGSWGSGGSSSGGW